MGCKTVQTFGDDKLTCVRKAGTHLTKYPHHQRVQIFYNGQLVEVVDNKSAGNAVRSAMTDFLRSHHKSLRALTERPATITEEIP